MSHTHTTTATPARRTAPPLLRESLIFLGFAALTIIMTWPWARFIRDAVPDTGDPYLNAWIMWWDYYQTFRDPLNLFHSPLFFPSRYTLAFSEHNYGIALLFFPLYALGARPLTVQGVAMLTGFALSGYGAFRLARTLTGSNGAAWVAGIVFGFAPYRFHQISHLNYVFAGWIPLLLEALVLFARARSWRRAAWLGVAFTMNALTCVHWFVLTLIPLAASGAYLLTRYRLWRDRDFWLRAAASLGLSALVLLPFFLPYRKVSEIYKLVRGPGEAALYSARVGNWLSADKLNHLWRGFGPSPEAGERALFPGMLPLLLMLAAFFLRTPGLVLDRAAREAEQLAPSGKLLFALDALAVVSLLIAVVAYGYGGVMPWGLRPLHVPDESRPLIVFTLIFFVRLCLAYPRALSFNDDRNLVETIRAARGSEAFGLGLIWGVLGFCGSLGMNFFFHRALFDYVSLFRSIRVPARWAMIAYVGLALLAGLGAKQLADALARRRPRLRSAAVRAFICALVCALLLFEQRAAPLPLARGEADPDALTVYLRETPMRGGIVHLPAGGVTGNYRYVLRQADHRRPLVTAVSGFGTPLLTEVETLSQSRPVPERFLDLLEEIPVSYLAVHDSLLRPEARASVNRMLADAIAAGRLRYVKSFAGSRINGNEGADLYAVTKTEPGARVEQPPLPPHLAPLELGAAVGDDPTVLLGEFESYSFPLARLHRTAYGRAPKFDEFIADAQAAGRGVVLDADRSQQQLQDRLRAFAAEWITRPEFEKAHAGETAEQFVAQVFANAGVVPTEAERAALVGGLNTGAETRASVLWKVVSHEEFIRRESKPALVLMHYFAYLRRNPGDPPDKNTDGYDFWLSELEKNGDRDRLNSAFRASGEYKDILEGKR